jgi:hypothetical protein
LALRLIFAIASICCALPSLVSSAVAEELRLDDSAWLTRASLIGIAQARKTDDSIAIRTGGAPSYDAYVIYPVEHRIDVRKHNLLELTMKTDPRIHKFRFHWKLIEGNQHSSYFFLQPIYRDGEFHTYLIALDGRPSWTGTISEIALGWTGAHGTVEIKQATIRTATVEDRLRVLWSQFWIPQPVVAWTINALGAPLLFGTSFAFPLTLLFVALLPLIYLRYRHRAGLGTEGSRIGHPAHAPPWVKIASLTFLIFWLLYDVRDAYNHVQTIRSDFRYAIAGAPTPRHYREIDDFYDFIDATKSVVPSESSIGFFSSRPLFYKARYLLFPQPVFDRGGLADYLLVFQDPHVTYRQGQLREESDVVADRVTPFGRFGEDAFIYKRDHD